MHQDSAKSNVFGIEAPHKWWCRVSGLSSAHTTLHIDVIRLQDNKSTPPFSEVFFLSFRKVAFFSGWMTWIGANFRISNMDEKLEFVQNQLLGRGIVNSEQLRMDIDIGIDLLRLYSLESADGKQIRILANGAAKMDKDNNILLEA
jgi:hypothetical protein